MMKIEDCVIKTIMSVELPIATACKMFMPFKGNCFGMYRNEHKFSGRYDWANSGDPDQRRSSLIRVSTVCYSICIFLKKYPPKIWHHHLNIR